MSLSACELLTWVKTRDDTASNKKTQIDLNDNLDKRSISVMFFSIFVFDMNEKYSSVPAHMRQPVREGHYEHKDSPPDLCNLVITLITKIRQRNSRNKNKNIFNFSLLRSYIKVPVCRRELW